MSEFSVGSSGEIATVEDRGYVVRLWDHDFQLLLKVEQGWRVDQPETVVLAEHHPAAKAMKDSILAGKMVWLTFDDAGDRWWGRLDRVEIVRSEDGRRTWVAASFYDDRIRQRVVADLQSMAREMFGHG